MRHHENGSLTAEAHNRIRSEIIACRLVPGQKLVIADLCETFGFSLGAVREALAALSSEGLVEAQPRKGFRVMPITEGELQDITRVRLIIESLCLESAIQNGDLKWEANIVSTEFELSRLPPTDPTDPNRVSEAWAQTHQRFHEALVAACDSPWLLRLRETLFVQSERHRRCSLPYDREDRDLIAEHKELAAAAIARDVPRALAALRTHLERTTEILAASDAISGQQKGAPTPPEKAQGRDARRPSGASRPAASRAGAAKRKKAPATAAPRKGA